MDRDCDIATAAVILLQEFSKAALFRQMALAAALRSRLPSNRVPTMATAFTLRSKHLVGPTFRRDCKQRCLNG